jgi:hypothetical protein
MLEATPLQARQILADNIRADLVTFMKGPPSTAKSAMTASLADEYNMLLIDYRLAQCDPTDLLGFPQVDPVTGRARYAPMETFPLEGDELPINPKTGKQYSGWLLFLDEFNSAGKEVQKAAYKLLLDRMVGMFRLHPNVRIVCAGNREEDGALVEEMSTALQSRMCHLRLRPDHASFMGHIRSEEWDHRIISFLEFKPSLVYTFDPDKAEVEMTYGCYRTWEFIHKQLKNIPDVDTKENLLLLFSSAIGEGIAREFITYLKNFAKLPKIRDIISHPASARIPKEPGQLYALSGAIGVNADKTTISSLVQYTLRMAKEYQVITLRNVLKNDMSLMSEPALEKWAEENHKELQ